MVTSDHTDPAYIVRRETENAIFRVLRAHHGPDAVVQRPITISTELDTLVLAPADWTQGVLAARVVAAYAAEMLSRFARKARGAGVSWAELAGPMAVSNDDNDLATAAFEEIAGDPLTSFDPVRVSWRCESCGAAVADYGPYNGHPDDSESGHRLDCARHRAAIAAYLAEFDSEGDD